MSAAVPISPSALKSAPCGSQVGQQVPERHAKNASMSASVPMSPSPLKSALPQEPVTVSVAAFVVNVPQELVTVSVYEPASEALAALIVSAGEVAPAIAPPLV